MPNTSSCFFYDNLELACLRAYPISVLRQDGIVQEGIARDLQTRNGAKEYLLLSASSNEPPHQTQQLIEIPLDDITEIQLHVPDSETLTLRWQQQQHH